MRRPLAGVLSVVASTPPFVAVDLPEVVVIEVIAHLSHSPSSSAWQAWLPSRINSPQYRQMNGPSVDCWVELTPTTPLEWRCFVHRHVAERWIARLAAVVYIHPARKLVGPPRVELGSDAPHAPRIPLPHGPAFSERTVL